MVKQNLDSTTVGAVQAEQKTRHKVYTGRERCDQENCKKHYIVVQNNTVLLLPGENQPCCSKGEVLPLCSPRNTHLWLGMQAFSTQTNNGVREQTLLKTSQ